MNQPFYTGKGIGVAILDTGIYPHIDFDSRICAFVDFILNKKMAYDDNGHGTCVAGSLPEVVRHLWENIRVRHRAVILWR